MECAMDHIVLNVEDDEKMIAFYSEVMDMATERLQEYRAGDVAFPSVRLNPDTIIDLFPKKLWMQDVRNGSGRPNLNHFCVVLAQAAWEVLRERLRGAGVAIENGPVSRWGARGRATSIYFRDPDGNLVEARYY